LVPVRLVPFALLAALPIAFPAGALGVVVESGPIAPGGTVAVSWNLPVGFEESELLIALEGGPRVRLTDESPEARPRVLVRLPALVGRARFVVRAGRKDASGRHRGTDVAFSESFSLSYSPVSGPIPVLAPRSRPAPGEETEWWAESTRPVREGPIPGMEERPTAATTLPGASSPGILPSSRSESDPGPTGHTPGFRKEGQAVPDPPERRFPERAFVGAPVPLRN
jgi:hypothetical protein